MPAVLVALMVLLVLSCGLLATVFAAKTLRAAAAPGVHGAARQRRTG